MKRNRYHRGKVPRGFSERKSGRLFAYESDCTHGGNVLFTVHFYCIKVRTIPRKMGVFSYILY